MTSVLVVGGGISGLAAAHRLHELAEQRSLPLRVSLLEASSRTGGVLSTVERDGFLLEEGPDSFVTDKPWARRLAERVGLGPRIIGTREEHRRSFVLRRGRLIPTPEGFHLLAPTRLASVLATPLFSPLGKARMALDLVIPRRRSTGDESVGSFVRRRLGREALERIAQPMLSGIYGADPETLSLKATLPRFHTMEAEHGSVIRAIRKSGRETKASGARYGLFASFDRGMESLALAVSGRLPSGTIRTGVRVESLRRAGEEWDVNTDRGAERHDAVLLALPAHASALLIEPLDAELSSALASIAYAGAATVSLAFPQDRVTHPLDGFGFVVPATERLSILGCTFFHRKYAGRAPEGWALLRAFWGPSAAGLPEESILDRTVAELRGPLGLRGDPHLTHVSRWPRSMPHYAVGHLDRVEAIERRAAKLPRLALAGNAYHGLGIPDCIHTGEHAAESIVSSLFPAP